MTKKLQTVFRKKATQALLLAITVLPGIHLYAQQATKAITDRFDTYRKENLQEKIFLHTDKNTYVPGELCWFKLYNVDASFHQLLDFEKCAYVELLDRSNRPVLQAKISMEKGMGNGSFSLPATLPSGNYRLRAYTSWMKNFGADFFFEKKLTVINVERNEAIPAAAVVPGWEIGFYPEGGNLVSGVENRIGFRLLNQEGKGVDAKGTILNNKGETIAHFQTLKFGIGSFSLTPVKGASYKAIVQVSGGDTKTVVLPPAADNAYSLHLEHRDGQVKVLVRAPGNTKSAPVYLLVHTRQALKAVQAAVMSNGEASFVVDDQKPGDGISQFTVFNDLRQPVCERLFFRQPAHPLQISAAPDQQQYGPRKKINIGIRAGDTAAAGVNMSMAVYRVDSLNGIASGNINSYLLLTSDLRGQVESPGYYFTKDDPSVAEAADNLMLTQGWRRFKWQDVVNGQQPAFQFLPEVNGHIVNAKLLSTQPGLPIYNVLAYLSVPGTRTQFQTASADAEGRLRFEMKNFYSDGDIVLQTDYEDDSSYRIEVASPFFEGYSQRTLPTFVPAAHNDDLLNAYIASQVQYSFLYNQLNRSSANVRDTTSFYLKPDEAYLLDNYTRFTTLEEVFREYVSLVNVRQHNGRFQLPVFDLANRLPFDLPPLVLLDGVPVFNLDKIMKYDPLKIRKLEVVCRQYYLGNNFFDGIINLTTYKGDMPGFELDPRATVIDYEGLQLQRDFYSPAYETAEQVNSRLPDFRHLLYWAPDLFMDRTGKTQASFYSSDIPGRYAVVVEGLGSDGRAGSGIAYFDVKKP